MNERFMSIEYRFTRRRYGSRACGTTRFFTWLKWRRLDAPEGTPFETYGDPWPKVRLNKRELSDALHAIVAALPDRTGRR